jgi:hypothetical protein
VSTLSRRPIDVGEEADAVGPAVLDGRVLIARRCFTGNESRSGLPGLAKLAALAASQRAGVVPARPYRGRTKEDGSSSVHTCSAKKSGTARKAAGLEWKDRTASGGKIEAGYGRARKLGSRATGSFGFSPGGRRSGRETGRPAGQEVGGREAEERGSQEAGGWDSGGGERRSG